MAKFGRSWYEGRLRFRYYYPNSPSKRGRYKQIETPGGDWIMATRAKVDRYIRSGR